MYIGGAISDGMFMRRSVRIRPICASVFVGESRFERLEREGMRVSLLKR